MAERTGLSLTPHSKACSCSTRCSVWSPCCSTAGFRRPSSRGTASRPGAARPRSGIVYKLAALFSLDAFGGGFVVQSLLALWLFERFDLSLATAGAIFFWTGCSRRFS